MLPSQPGIVVDDTTRTQQSNTALAPERTNKLLVDAATLAKLLDVSPRHIARMDIAGKLPMARRIGKCKRWSTAEIEAWIASGCPDRTRWMAVQAAAAKRKA